MQIEFCSYEEIAEVDLKFSVVIALYQNQYVLVQHKERTTFEFPGGHRELEETIDACAERELFEETGALDFTMKRHYVYGVRKDKVITYGGLFLADIQSFGKLPESEIKKVCLFTDLPKIETLTYPPIYSAFIHELFCNKVRETIISEIKI